MTKKIILGFLLMLLTIGIASYATAYVIVHNFYGDRNVRVYGKLDFGQSGIGGNLDQATYFIKAINRSGTTEFRVDSDGVQYATTTVGKIDSFATTTATDTITWPSAAVGDLFFVTPRLPTWSIVPDTGSCPYGAGVSSAGKVVVTRTKLNAASTLKSAANFFIFTFRKI